MIAIDIGNSRIKWAKFEAGEMTANGACSYRSEDFEAAITGLEIPLSNETVGVSLVASDAIRQQLQKYLETMRCTNIDFASSQPAQLGVVNGYSSAEQLGVDRWLAMVAAYHYPDRVSNEALCVIDAGTAVTMDLIQGNGKHLGGLIMPGYRSMLNAMVLDAARLELAELESVEEVSLGHGTEQAMRQGVRRLLSEGLSAMINAEADRLGMTLHLFVTGGDAEWLCQRMDRACICDPWLVLKGLELVTPARARRNN